MIADPQPCTLHIQIRQTVRFRALPSERLYTIPELCMLWGLRPQTIYNYLWRLKKSGSPPEPGQIRIRRLPGKSGRASPFRRALHIRADYARTIAETFLEKNIPF